MASSNRDAGEGLILCDGLTLVVLHNCDLRQGSVASSPPHLPVSSVIILLAWLHGQAGCWHLPRCSSDWLMPSDENKREHNMHNQSRSHVTDFTTIIEVKLYSWVTYDLQSLQHEATTKVRKSTFSVPNNTFTCVVTDKFYFKLCVQITRKFILYLIFLEKYKNTKRWLRHI